MTDVSKNVKRAWWEKYRQEEDIRPYDYRRAWNLRDNDTLPLPESIDLLAWLADEAGADYWGITICKTLNNKVHVGCNHDNDDGPEFDIRPGGGDERVTKEHVLEAIDRIVEEHPEVVE